ncbi:MAG: hypothetical protein H8E55_25630 [Pelagibacterales bacterium]|nr:hypothetical protein [Pelagibacterales bacterium]|tara:strand:- start:227 stop:703 length:477 start_codon:yes stop_codon:yes gene_type:complete
MNKLQKTLLGQIHNYKYNKLIIFDKKEDILKQLSIIPDKFKIKHVMDNKSIEQYNNSDSLIIYVIDKKVKEKTKTSEIISRLTLLNPENIIVISPSLSKNYSDDSFYKTLISFGYKLLSFVKERDVFYFFYAYNISNYKNIPDWLNNENWANPELWEK